MLEYRIIRSDRRTLSLQITDEGLVVRAPKRMTDRQIRQFVEQKEKWIPEFRQEVRDPSFADKRTVLLSMFILTSQARFESKRQ